VARGARGERRAEGGQDVLAVDDKGGQRDGGVDAAEDEASGGEDDRDDEFGCLRGEWGHCTNRNLSMPSWVPASMRLLANGFAHARMIAAATTNIATTVTRRARLGSSPSAAAAPIRSGSSTSPRDSLYR